MDQTNHEMNIESLKLKIENQNKILKELTSENEELYHQYNHLIIRNGKMLKRVDDLQKIIDDLHIRIEELQLINGNMLQLNDKLRTRNQNTLSQSLSDLRTETGITSPVSPDLNMDELYDRWKNYPGQTAQNAPNLKKQILMLACLYSTNALRAADLFHYSGVGGVTGARYISVLKKFALITFNGARKKGHYEITESGKEFIENTSALNKLHRDRATELRSFSDEEVKRESEFG